MHTIMAVEHKETSQEVHTKEEEIPNGESPNDVNSLTFQRKIIPSRHSISHLEL